MEYSVLMLATYRTRLVSVAAYIPCDEGDETSLKPFFSCIETEGVSIELLLCQRSDSSGPKVIYCYDDDDYYYSSYAFKIHVSIDLLFSFLFLDPAVRDHQCPFPTNDPKF